MAKEIISGPAWPFASRIACFSDPAPDSAVVVTGNVSAWTDEMKSIAPDAPAEMIIDNLISTSFATAIPYGRSKPYANENARRRNAPNELGAFARLEKQ